MVPNDRPSDILAYTITIHCLGSGSSFASINVPPIGNVRRTWPHYAMLREAYYGAIWPVTSGSIASKFGLVESWAVGRKVFTADITQRYRRSRKWYVYGCGSPAASSCFHEIPHELFLTTTHHQHLGSLVKLSVVYIYITTFVTHGSVLRRRSFCCDCFCSSSPTTRGYEQLLRLPYPIIWGCGRHYEPI